MSDRYKEWIRRNIAHYQEYHLEGNQRTGEKNPSCIQCFSMRGEIFEDFALFWGILRESKIPVNTYNRNTVQAYYNVKGKVIDKGKEHKLWRNPQGMVDFVEGSDERMKDQIDKIIESIHYKEEPPYRMQEMRY